MFFKIKTILSLTLIVNYSGFFVLGQDIDRCPGEGWKEYSDSKCYKLIRSYASRPEAYSMCKIESLAANLASVKSLEEQNFLTHYIYNESMLTIGVWLALAKHELNEENLESDFVWTDFVWTDGYSTSPAHFTNWAENYPSNRSGRMCVEMVPKFSNSEDEDGQWKDVGCEQGNYFICEKLQIWTELESQTKFLYMRDEMRQEILHLKEQNLKNLADIETLKANPGQPIPSETWPMVTWTEISWYYSGLFFRVTGGDAEEFNQIQESNSPRFLAAALFKNNNQTQTINGELMDISLIPGIWSKHFFTTSPNNGGNKSLRFLVSDGETRPKNTAIRIWIRTA